MKRTMLYQPWNTKTRKISTLLLASFLIVALTLGGCATAKATSPTTQIPTAPLPSIQIQPPVTNETATTAFQFDRLLIYPEKGAPGQEIIILAAVANTGGNEGEYIAKLEINKSLEEQARFALPSGEAGILKFSTFRYEPGTYDVVLEGLTGQFEVLDQAAVAGPAAAGCGGGCGGSSASTGQAGGGCGGCVTSSGPVTLGSPPTAGPQVQRGGCGGCGG